MTSPGMSWPVSGRLVSACGQVGGFCRSVRDGGRDSDRRRDPRRWPFEANAGGRPLRGGREGLGGVARRAAAGVGGPSEQ